MPTCAAWGCNNRQGQCEDKSISFHRFPKDQNKKKIWIEKIDRGQPDESSKTSKVKKHGHLVIKQYFAQIILLMTVLKMTGMSSMD